MEFVIFLPLVPKWEGLQVCTTPPGEKQSWSALPTCFSVFYTVTGNGGAYKCPESVGVLVKVYKICVFIETITSPKGRVFSFSTGSVQMTKTSSHTATQSTEGPCRYDYFSGFGIQAGVLMQKVWLHCQAAAVWWGDIWAISLDVQIFEFC